MNIWKGGNISELDLRLTVSVVVIEKDTRAMINEL